MKLKANLFLCGLGLSEEKDKSYPQEVVDKANELAQKEEIEEQAEELENEYKKRSGNQITY